jgi:hypothetical protein
LPCPVAWRFLHVVAIAIGHSSFNVVVAVFAQRQHFVLPYSLHQGTTPSKEPPLLASGTTAAATACLLVEERELALLGRVASGAEVLERLLASHHLAAANNAAVLVLDKVSLLEATGGVLRRSVENLGLRTDCGRVIHLILRTRVLFCLDHV